MFSTQSATDPAPPASADPSGRSSRATRAHSASVRAKVLAGLLLVALLPMAALGYVSHRSQRDAAHTDATTRVDAAADSMAERLTETVRRDLTLLNVVGTDDRLADRAIEYRDAPGAETAAAVRTRLLRLANWPILSITMLDRAGNVVATTDASADRLAAAGLADVARQSQLLGTVIALPDGSLAALSHAPLLADGETAGTVVVETDVADLVEVVSDVRGLGATGRVQLVQRNSSGDAQVIVDSAGRDRPFVSTVPARNTANLTNRALAGEDAVVESVDATSGEDLFAATRRVELAGWGVVASVTETEALAPASEFRRVVLVTLLVATLLVFLAASIVTRMITRPIERLTAAAVAVAGGDLSTRAEVRSQDEIGTLSRAFNTMTDALVDIAGDEAERTAELRVTNRRLHENEGRIRAILDHAADGIMHIDDQGRILEFNAAAEQLFARSADQLHGATASSLMRRLDANNGAATVHGDEVADESEVFHGLLAAAEAAGGSGLEVIAGRGDGTERAALLTLTRIDDGATWSYSALVRDISERVAFERRLEHQATHDTLTGLPNRSVLTSELDKALSDVRRSSRSAGVLFLDIDRFKTINDTLGHQAGDELLVEVANRLRVSVRPTDMVARFGGDEFVILARDLAQAEDMIIVANRVAAAARKPFLLAEEEVHTSFSIGIAISEGGSTPAEELVGNADVAMYRAKQGGRDRIEVFDAQMRERIEQHHEMEQALRRGLDEDEVFCEFQPIVRTRDGEVVGVEALARWERADRGRVPPDEFIPVAEESGLIQSLGHRVMVLACRQQAEWSREHPERPLTMAVNVSGRQLADHGFVDSLRLVLDETGADPTMLTFEITETVLMHDLQRAVATLDELRGLGIRIAIDDFGTGYSSLTYLRKFPIDVVKIDRAFIDELEDLDPETSIAAMVAALAENLSLDVVAEGVETQTQADALLTLRVGFGQGYYYGKPMTGADIATLAWWPDSVDADVVEPTN